MQTAGVALGKVTLKLEQSQGLMAGELWEGEEYGAQCGCERWQVEAVVSRKHMPAGASILCVGRQQSGQSTGSQEMLRIIAGSSRRPASSMA